VEEPKFDENYRPFETLKPTSVPRARKITTILKLNNNSLENLGGLDTILPRIMLHPQELRMLDLSFNNLHTIEKVLVKAAPNLSVLKLHANAISRLAAVDQLAQLPLLITLTLHGNDVDQNAGYRNYVISGIPSLKSLDFTTITPKDRNDAVTWRRIHGPKKTRGQFQ